MAEHKDLLDTSLHCHNPQGFTAASNDTVLSKGSGGSLAWVGKNTLIGTTDYGEMYMTSTQSITMTVVDTYYQAITFTEGNTNNMTFADSELKIVTAGDYFLMATICASNSVTGPDDFTFAIGKDAGDAGTYSAITGTATTRSLGTTTGSLAIQGVATGLAVDDTIGLLVKCADSAMDCDIASCNFFAFLLRQS